MRFFLFLITLLIAGRVNAQDCDGLEREQDKFTKEVRLSFPTVDGISIQKNISRGTPVYYLFLRARGSTANVAIKGVTILLTNGKRINRPQESIDVDADENSFAYTAFLTLKPADLQLLKANTITDYRLYIYDATVKSEVAESLKRQVGCLLAAK